MLFCRTGTESDHQESFLISLCCRALIGKCGGMCDTIGFCLQQSCPVLQADEVRHTVSDKLHELQHRAGSSIEEAQQKASNETAKVSCNITYQYVVTQDSHLG